MTNQPLTRQLFTYFLSIEPTHIHICGEDGCDADCENEGEVIQLTPIHLTNDIRSAIQGLLKENCDGSYCITQDSNNDTRCFRCSQTLKWFPVFKDEEVEGRKMTDIITTRCITSKSTIKKMSTYKFTVPDELDGTHTWDKPLWWREAGCWHNAFYQDGVIYVQMLHTHDLFKEVRQ